VSRSSYLFTSESVSEGHPDKVCDRISDEVVDAFFEIAPKHGWDPRQVRVACETLATTNRIVIAGETRGPSAITRDYISHIARLVVKDIGYEQAGFHWEKASVEVHLHAQSSDIAQGVDSAGNKDEGAGDQGIMFGYACRETPELMPAPIFYAHRILKVMAQARHSGESTALGPDAKSQVTVRYENGKPVEATQIVVSTQHYDEKLSSHDIQAIIEPYVGKALPAGWITKQTVWHVNPTGTPASPGARSSSTPMGARRRMAAAPFRARTRPRSTVPPPMPHAISPRTWSRQGSPIAAPSRSPTRSASPSLSRSTSISTAPARSPRPASKKRSAR
jgi:S-adenosylmethionine synthetase